MAGKEVDREASQDLPPQQPCTVPILKTDESIDSANREPILIPVLGTRPDVDSSESGRDLSTQQVCTVPLFVMDDDLLPEEPCTVPLLQGSSSVDSLCSDTLNSLDQTDLQYVDLCTSPSQQDLASRGPFVLPLLPEQCTIPLLSELGLGRGTPMGTPIPGCAHLHSGTHNSLSGTSTPIIDCKSLSIDSVSLILPGLGCNFDSKSQLSMMSDTNSALLPICRICHLPGDERDILISPCRCAGTLLFIHNTCLMHWLEITTKKSRKPPKCELCRYQYHRHKKFKFHHWRFPFVSRQDKVLHVIFLLNLIVMIGCAIATVMCFLSDKEHINNFPRNHKVELSKEEIITLSCGVLFFVSFFIAMSVQIKAKHTVYQLFVKFIMQNMEWEIDEYDKAKDSMYMVKGSSAYV